MAFEDAAAYLPIHSPLCGHNCMLKVFALGRKVEAIVEASTPAHSGELIAQSTHFAIQRETFKIQVCSPKDAEAGSLIATARFDADKSVLDNVNAADPVLPSESICGEEELQWFGGGSRLGDKFSRNASGKGDSKILRIWWSRFGVSSQLPHVLWRSSVGIF